MAVTVTHLTDDSSTLDGTSFTTASISPAANTLILLTLLPAAPSGAVGAISSVTGCGLTWVPVNATSGGQRTNNVYRAMGPAPTPGPITVTMATTTGALIWSLDQFSGVVTTGASGADAIVQSVQDKPTATTSANLPFPTAPTAGNALFGAVGVAANTAGMTAGSGWTLGIADTVSTPSSSLFTEHAEGASLPTAVTGSWTTSAVPYIVGVEIKAAAAAVSGGGALTTASPILSGTGTVTVPVVTGGGALSAATAMLTANGVTVVAGSAAMTATSPTLAGAGTITVPTPDVVTASGSLTPGVASLVGAATLRIDGTGAPSAFTAAAPQLDGGGTLRLDGAGELTAQSATLAATGLVVDPTTTRTTHTPGTSLLAGNGTSTAKLAAALLATAVLASNGTSTALLQPAAGTATLHTT